MPAVAIFIDNYASFKEKTGEQYEEMLITLSKEGVSQGIFLVLSGGSIGMNDVTSRVCENISTAYCLQLQEKYEYTDILHTNQIEVMPESGIKGRGLVDYEGRILEFQAVLALRAENDYERMELIRAQCEELKRAWTGKPARQVPEIPKKPVWSAFHLLDDYKKRLADQNLLPVGYDMANAQVYGIPLRRTYCYTAYGAARSGKTNFLKVCLQAAMEKQGSHVCVIDSEAQEFHSYAGTGIAYVENDKGLYEFFTQLLPVFKERNQNKRMLQSNDMEEDEIYEAMSRYEPYFIFIADLKQLVQLVNGSEYEMKGFFKNILEKGSMHSIYFFSAVSSKDHQEIFGDELYDTFTGYKTGVHFGGNTADNRILNFEYLPYMEQTKVLPPGVGCLPDAASQADTAKIVVPLARR